MCKRFLRNDRAMSLSVILFIFCFQFVLVSNVTAQGIGCNNSVQVSIDGTTCNAVITPDMILEGAVPPGALLSIDGGPRMPSVVVTEKGTYEVTVYESSATNANSCWGTMTVEDKIAPVITGSANAQACAATPYATDFAIGGPVVNLDFADEDCRALASYFVAGTLPATGSIPLAYTVTPVTISVNGAYTFTPQNGAACNYVFNLYPAGAFDPADPCNTDNLLAFGGLSTISGISQAGTASLDAGNYELVICSIDPTCSDVILRECTFSCNNLTALLDGEIYNAQPLVDECNDYTCDFADVVLTDICNGSIVTRTWICEDDCGNISATYDEVFTIDPVDLNEVLAPDPSVYTSCGVDSDPQSIYDYLIDNGFSEQVALNSAWPMYYGSAMDEQTICNIAVTYTDQVIPTCGSGCNGNSKVIRTWNLVNWCQPGSAPLVFVQVIIAQDNEGPTITLNQTEFTSSVHPWTCEVNFTAPEPDILHDNCDNIVTYEITGPLGSVVNGNVVTGLGIGTHTLTYTAVDCCGNQTVETITLYVVDETPPVAVATQDIVVSLTYDGAGLDGGAKLFNTSVDNGSHDGCTDVFFEIRRDDGTASSPACGVTGNSTYNNDGHSFDSSTDPDDGEFVKFCCDDVYGPNGVDVDGDGINDYGIVKVWMRVFDLNGNYNETWTNVRVEDKLAPYLTCPPDITIDCDDDPSNLDMVGEAVSTSPCGNKSVIYVDNVNMNSCNYGYINRKWSVVGRPDVFCVQRIDILPGDPFDGDDIQWPNDVETDCTDLGFTGIPTWVSGACDIVAHSMESDTFYFESGACLKVLNQFTVIDWCQYDPNDPLSGGIWYHTQVVKVIDNEGATMTCSDVMLEVNDHEDSDNDGVICEGVGLTLTNTAMDNGACASDWLKWEVSIDLWGDGSYEYVYSSALPSNNPYYLAPTSNGGVVTVNLPDIDGSMNNHKALWKVTDGCANTVSCTQYFMVVDKKAPTPYCVNISTALMQSGTVDLWAIDFDLGASDNCTEQDDLRFTFSDVPPHNDPSYIPSLSSSAHTFDCSDIPDTPGAQVPVNVYVWDEKDNYSFCTVYLTLIDNNNACGLGTLTAPIAGRVSTEVGENVEDVQMELSTDGIVGFPINQMTNAAGDYAFYNNPMYLDYEVQGNKSDDYMNGVSTLDLLLIQKHLLNIQPFNSPYKVIAADVNSDSNISAIDLIELRKLILGIYLELPSNDSWRFVDAGQTWSNAMDPFPFTEVLQLANVTTPMMAEDFVGVKIGDVNNTVQANAVSVTTENRSPKSFKMVVENVEVAEGDNIEISFVAKEAMSLSGYQFTLNTANLQFNEVKSGLLNSSNIGIHEGALTVSWNDIEDLEVREGQELFVLSFNSKENAQLQNTISLTDRLLRSEAYVSNGSEILDLDLEFRNGTEIDETFVLYQNEPNPFTQATTIGFDLPTHGEATLTVFDVSGKVITQVQRDFEKGFNQITLNKSDIPVAGILYYQLESGSFTATKKMILID